MILIFLILTFFACKMTSQSWRQIVLLVLWDILYRFVDDLVTQISKLKKSTSEGEQRLSSLVVRDRLHEPGWTV